MSCHAKAPPIEDQVRAHLRDLVVCSEMVETIGQRRFQGYDVLLPEHREELDDLIKQAEHQLVRVNDHLDFLIWKKKESGQRTPKLPQPIEWETLSGEVKDDTAAHVGLLVDMARAEACEMMGEHKRALAFADRHLSFRARRVTVGRNAAQGQESRKCRCTRLDSWQ